MSRWRTQETVLNKAGHDGDDDANDTDGNDVNDDDNDDNINDDDDDYDDADNDHDDDDDADNDDDDDDDDDDGGNLYLFPKWRIEQESLMSSAGIASTRRWDWLAFIVGSITEMNING